MAMVSLDSRLLAASLVVSAALLFPTTAHTQQSFTHRLTTVLYDYDNNGVTDATGTFTYASGLGTGTSYVYTGDGVADLFVTEDDDAAQETGVVGYNADDLLDSFSLTRQLMQPGTEQFDTTLTFTAGELTRVDSSSTLGGSTNSTFTTLSYAAGRLDEIVERNSSDNSLVFSQSYAYGSDDLPNLVSFDSPGIDAVTTMSWRSDGQLDDLSSTSTFGGNPLGSGGADYIYDSAGFLQSEAWTFNAPVGSFFAEFQGVNYRKTLTYDASNLKVLEEIDIGDDGSVEATRTFVWEAGPCVPAFIFASNGRPNFARMDGLPYVPGTGATWFENCGPVAPSGPNPAPVPAISPGLQATLAAALGGIGALGALVRGRRRRAA